MNWWKLLKYIYKHIGNIYRKFFWNKNKDEKNCKSVLTIPSDKIYRPKYEGDLGIRKTEDTNAAFLAK